MEAIQSSHLRKPYDEQISRSKQWALDKERGIILPSGMGFQDGKDRHGRPQRVNLYTVSDYLAKDVLAFDRFMLPVETKKFPLFDFQRLIMQEAMQRQFLWLQLMRGGAKTYTIARFVLDYCLMNPGVPVVLTGPSFRQALLMFDEIVRIVERNDRDENAPVRVGSEIVGEVKRNTLESLVRFKNTSSVRAIPMGDGRKIRGLRGGLLVLDEFYQMTEELYESHVLPFVQIKQGGKESKVVHITTSWYQDCFAYRRLMQIASEVKAGNDAYGILDFNLEDLVTCGFPLSENIWKDARRHGNPTTFAMTYYNVWPSSAFRWYEQKVIDDAISAQHEVRVELQRDKKEKDVSYFAVIDLAASEKGDSTVTLVFRYEHGKAKCIYGKSTKGLGPSQRAWEVHELHRKFNPDFVIYDSHGAIGVDLRNDLAKDKLIIDGAIRKVQPLVHHDDYHLRGEHILIPVSSKDTEVIKALTGMPRDGRIEGEDGLNNLLHTKTRDLLWAGEIVGPSPLPTLVDGSKQAEDIEYSGSQTEVMDVIRTAFQQLADVGLSKDANGDQIRTKSGQLVFKTKPGAHDDGAMCIVYSSIGILRLIGNLPDQSRPRGEARPMAARPALPKSSPIVNRQKLTFA